MQNETVRRKAGQLDLSYVIVNFNGMRVLERTLRSLYANAPAGNEVIVADDGSTDGSCEWIRSHYPRVRVVWFESNTGNVNKVRNLGLNAAVSRYVFLMDNDISIQPGCVESMLRTMDSGPDVVCVTPRLVDREDTSLIHSDGNQLHFIGVSCRSARGTPLDQQPCRDPFPTFGGGIMLIDTEIFADVGQFDTKYAWGWGEDAEFQLRCRLAGRQALHDPRALCIHDGYERGLERAQAQIQNRYRLLCTYYRIRTLVLIIPSLILFECALTALSVYQGLWRQRFRGAANIARQFADIRKTRRELQALRKVPDRELLDDRSMDTPEYGRKSSWIKGLFALFSGFLRLNWVLVRNWV